MKSLNFTFQIKAISDNRLKEQVFGSYKVTSKMSDDTDLFSSQQYKTSCYCLYGLTNTLRDTKLRKLIK
jgi:hypothetical protein